MFHLHGNDSTVAPETSERKRQTMLDQIASGERDQSVLGSAPPPTVQRWRSLAVLHPQLMAEWHPTRNRDLDPYMVGQYSRLKIWWRCRDCGTTGKPRRMTAPSPVGDARRVRGGDESRRRSSATGAPRSVRNERSRSTSGPAEGVAPDAQRRARSAQGRRGLGAHRLVALQHRRLWAGVEGDGREQDEARTLGCPRCAHRLAGQRRARADREQSFGALHPHLLDEWHPTRNGGVDPYAIKARIGASSVVAVRVLRSGLAGAADVAPA